MGGGTGGAHYNKRKKFHDKDKYYRLAKEQGFRSRAAFKLSQINRKFPILQNASVVLDLCAAPGGWTQVAARTMAGSKMGGSGNKKHSQNATHIVAVDILPIRSFRGHNNITTIVGDITTSKTKADITQAVKRVIVDDNSRNNSKHGCVDVVLHDGAPNVGASYDKDAYEQNEIAVHALKCATQHLRKGGTYVTKVYRSRDYTSFLWVCQQFFKQVQAFKPKASRIQSAEIFLICENYIAPTKIDPKLLDPKYIFEAAEEGGAVVDDGGTVITTATSQQTKTVNVFHKSWDTKRRKRDGYDMDHYDATMRHIQSIAEFIETKGGMKEAIHILSQSTGLSFNCGLCTDNKNDDNNSSSMKPKCNCQFYLRHPLTTPEIKECVSDLKVLNKSDFKGLVLWRTKMVEALKAKQEQEQSDDDDENEDSDDEDGMAAALRRGRKAAKGEEGEGGDGDASDDASAAEEAEIAAEVQALREKKVREKKKVKKKERLEAAKRRKRAALGMDLNAIDVPEHDQTFSLATLNSKGDLEAFNNNGEGINLDQITDEQLYGKQKKNKLKKGSHGKMVIDDELHYASSTTEESSDEEDDEEQQKKPSDGVYRMDDELDAEYERYLRKTKNLDAKAGTKMMKRSKKVQRLKVAQEADEDQQLLLTSQSGIAEDMKTYAKLLAHGSKQHSDDDSDDNAADSESESDSDSDDGFTAEPMTPEEHAAKANKKQQKQTRMEEEVSDDDDSDDDSDDEMDEENPLIHKIDEATSVKTARWFSNPIFSQIGMSVEQSQDKKEDERNKKRNKNIDSSDSESDNEEIPSSDSESDDNEKSKKKGKKNKKKKKPGLDADEVLALMPKTDKEKRHERRLKAMAREERRQARKARLENGDHEDGTGAGQFEIAPADDDDSDSDNDDNNLTPAQKQKLSEAKALIKAGMGKGTGGVSGTTGNNSKIEIVPAEDERPVPIVDGRRYDSDNEDYDSDDYAETLALGTMMLRQSKAKALVDASYNRYAWNDPSDLPEWFIDDERKYYRPQLPIPPALLAKIKAKQLALSVKPIAKVAEARARKNKRLKSKLAAAKKQAEAVANNSELSESMKLRQISKALRNQETKRPSKTYVVAKKSGGGKQGGKGIKLVDKRMKNDKRSMDRSVKKRKKGKQNKMTGSKKRRVHK